MAAPIHKVFIGGGGDDWFTHIVEDYEAAYRRLNPDCVTYYYSWTQQFAVGRLLASLPQGAHVTVVGHSYGGDCAFSAVQKRQVDVLVSIDPVGRRRPSWVSIRSKAKVWLNVRAEPDAGHRTTDDTIAAIGGKYPLPPGRGEAGAPNHSLTANATHGAFRTMMNAVGDGVSGASLLGGNRVG